MSSVRLSTKGQLVIPARYEKHWTWRRVMKSKCDWKGSGWSWSGLLSARPDSNEDASGAWY